MALPISIESLLTTREIESNRIEYKRDWNPRECIRTICAFANDIENLDGGYITFKIRFFIRKKIQIRKIFYA